MADAFNWICHMSHVTHQPSSRCRAIWNSITMLAQSGSQAAIKDWIISIRRSYFKQLGVDEVSSTIENSVRSLKMMHPTLQAIICKGPSSLRKYVGG
jgi:hypothetical protein